MELGNGKMHQTESKKMTLAWELTSEDPEFAG